MGTVYMAKHQHQRDLVAVKVGRPEIHGIADGAAIFLNEIGNASALQHPNIVRIYTSGTTGDGTPYLVMPLFEQGTLSEPQNHRTFSAPARAMALMIQIARAVQFAHERLILHCDLKPDNIMIDSTGAPHVSDFGLARVIGSAGYARVATIMGGNKHWMSPEQLSQMSPARRGPVSLTAASDVFGLGVMLGWLLTPPADPSGATQQGRRPRRLLWELGAIAHRQPTRAGPPLPIGGRWRTLECVRDDYPIAAERDRPFRRAAKWIRRHRLVTVIAVQVLLLLLYFALVPISVLHEVRSTIRQRNEFAALAQARAVMNELRSLATRIKAMAVAPEIRALINHPNVYAPPLRWPIASAASTASPCSDERYHAGPLPAPEHHLTNPQFQITRLLSDSGPAHEERRRRRRGRMCRALFAPPGRASLHRDCCAATDRDGNPIGVVLGSTLARATFGAVQMNCASNGNCMTALLGCARSRRSRRTPDQQGQRIGRAWAVGGGRSGAGHGHIAEDVQRSSSACHDCTTNSRFRRSGRRWCSTTTESVSNRLSIAAMAPVGGTGLVVLVATPNSAADALTMRMIDRMKAFLWIPIAPGLLLLCFVIGTLAWRRLLGPPGSAVAPGWRSPDDSRWAWGDSNPLPPASEAGTLSK